jgi:hypothetical protein
MSEHCVDNVDPLALEALPTTPCKPRRGQCVDPSNQYGSLGLQARTVLEHRPAYALQAVEYNASVEQVIGVALDESQ